jgi:hypothetical protein
MDHEPLLRDVYATFNARAVDAVSATLHPDVDLRMDVIEPEE